MVVSLSYKSALISVVLETRFLWNKTLKRDPCPFRGKEEGLHFGGGIVLNFFFPGHLSAFSFLTWALFTLNICDCVRDALDLWSLGVKLSATETYLIHLIQKLESQAFSVNMALTCKGGARCKSSFCRIKSGARDLTKIMMRYFTASSSGLCSIFFQ